MVYLYAFLIGGAFCAVAQILIDKTSVTPARILVFYVCAGVFLSGIGVYKKIAAFAGAGASVPLLGFGHTLAKGVAKAIRETGWLGAFVGGVKGMAGGLAFAMLFSLLAAIFFHGKPENL